MERNNLLFIFDQFIFRNQLFQIINISNFTRALFGSLLRNQWQSSMLEESILTSSFWDNLRAVSSSSQFSIDSGRPLSSKHSRLEQWQLLQNFRFNKIISHLRFVLRFVLKLWLYFLIILPEVRYFFIYMWQGGITLGLIFQSQNHYFALRYLSLQCRCK